MVWIDYAIIAVIAFSSLVSLIRGFVREALFLMSRIIHMRRNISPGV
jgi:uncharacterized membrane protein required for colicin V production